MKIFVFCTKYILFVEKNIFSCKTKISCREKKNYYQEKLFFEKKNFFYAENVCVANKNIYLSKLCNHSAKKIFDHKKYNFLTNSIISYFKHR